MRGKGKITKGICRLTIYILCRKNIQEMMYDLNVKREHSDRKFKHDDTVGWNMVDNKNHHTFITNISSIP